MQGADNIVLDPVTGLRVVEASRAHVEVDSYGNEIKEESKVDALKASTKEERVFVFLVVDGGCRALSQSFITGIPYMQATWAHCNSRIPLRIRRNHCSPGSALRFHDHAHADVTARDSACHPDRLG
jgi:hypothetical protein